MKKLMKNPMNTPKNARRGGWSLLELMMALALTGTVAGSLTAAWNASLGLFESGTTRATLEAQARRALERFSRELRGASASSLAGVPESPVWQTTLDFDRILGMRAGDGRVTWSSSRAELVLDPDETNNGLDDDGDGLVDEGQFVLTETAGGGAEVETVLARDVRENLEGELPNGADDNGNGLIDERGLAFERVGDDLRVYLTLEARDRDGRTVTRTLETTVWSRN